MSSSTTEKLITEFKRQVAMLRDVGQVAMLKIVVEEFQTKPVNRPVAQWPRANVERRFTAVAKGEMKWTNE